MDSTLKMGRWLGSRPCACNDDRHLVRGTLQRLDSISFDGVRQIQVVHSKQAILDAQCALQMSCAALDNVLNVDARRRAAISHSNMSWLHPTSFAPCAGTPTDSDAETSLALRRVDPSALHRRHKPLPVSARESSCLEIWLYTPAQENRFPTRAAKPYSVIPQWPVLSSTHFSCLASSERQRQHLPEGVAPASVCRQALAWALSRWPHLLQSACFQMLSEQVGRVLRQEQ